MKIFLLILIVLACLPPPAEAYPYIFHSGEVLPAPQRARYGDYVNLACEEKAGVAVIIGESASDLDALSAEHISRAVSSASGGAVGAWVLSPAEFAVRRSDFSAALVLGSARANSFAAEIIEKNGCALPENPEGYIVRYFGGGDMHVILASGSSRRGTYYAARSLMQLFKHGDGSLLFRKADIFDYPAFRLRISGNDEKIPGDRAALEAVEWLSMFKLNGWAAGQSYLWPDDWRRMPEDRAEGLKEAARHARGGVIDIMFQVHPFGRMRDGSEWAINIHSFSEIDALYAVIEDMLEAGVENILLRADDFHELTEKDAEIFGTKALAHSRLLNAVYGKIKEAYPGAGVFFCPPYYTGGEILESAEKEDYFKTLRASLPEDIVIVWTGPEVCSDEIKAAEVRGFRAFSGRRLLLWDNTVFRCRSNFGYAYEYAFYLLNALETGYPSDFNELVEGIRYNYGYDGTQISKIANIVLADYLWNPGAYVPAESLMAAISAVAGKEAAGPIQEFSEQIHNAYDLYHSPARLFSLKKPLPPERYSEMLEDIREKTSNVELAEELNERFFRHRESIAAVWDLYSEFKDASDYALVVKDFSKGRARASRRGQWSISRGGGVAEFSFPFNTPSSPGALGGLQGRMRLPASGTGKYYLVFIPDADYNLGGRGPLWDGYLYSQVLVNGEVVWERDVAEPNEFIPQSVDVTRFAEGARAMNVTVRGYDKKGVYNLGARIAFSVLLLTDRPPENFIESSGSKNGP